MEPASGSCAAAAKAARTATNAEATTTTAAIDILRPLVSRKQDSRVQLTRSSDDRMTRSIPQHREPASRPSPPSPVDPHGQRPRKRSREAMDATTNGSRYRKGEMLSIVQKQPDTGASQANSVEQRTPVFQNPYASSTTTTPSSSQGSATMKNPYATAGRVLQVTPAIQPAVKPLDTPLAAAPKVIAQRATGAATAKGVERVTEKVNSVVTLESSTVHAWGRSIQERFACALCRWSVTDYLEAAVSDSKARTQWLTICQSLGLEPPLQKIRPIYPNAKAHFEARMALVMEEQRYEIAEQVNHYWNWRWISKKAMWKRGPKVRVQSANILHKDKNVRHVDLWLSGNDAIRGGRGICDKDWDYLKRGSIYLCVPEGARVDEMSAESTSLLYVYQVAPPHEHQFEGLVFEKGTLTSSFEKDVDDAAMTVPVLFDLYELGLQTGLIFDQYYFCHLQWKRGEGVDIEPIWFEHQLLGNPFRHLSRKDSTDEERRIFPMAVEFHPTQLNDSQQIASDTFLLAPRSSITMVQGPPGTGKTTMITAIIARFFERPEVGISSRPKLLVCAPTNKAVAVLARRFFESVRNWDECNLRAHICGVESKILLDGFDRREDNPLYHMFLGTWMTRILASLAALREASFESLETARSTAKCLCSRLKDNLPGAWEMGLKRLSSDLCYRLDAGAVDVEAEVLAMEGFLRNLEETKPRTVWNQLVKSSDLIFCTLASSARIKNAMGKIDDLIIDEAAATTEPLMYLPMFMDPRRLLVVGDPKQLPSVVKSPLATKLGLADSFQERIMEHCKSNTHIMLDTQYRMHHTIAAFPMAQFYDGRLLNGSNVVAAGFNAGKPLLFDGRPFVFQQTTNLCEPTNCGQSLCNSGEADMVVNLVQELRRRSNGAEHWCDPNCLRVITFYTHQVRVLKQRLTDANLRNVHVGTVDATQGSEADVCIVSFVRDFETAGFLTDNRRMNVALTRARHQLVCVGNVRKIQALKEVSARALRALATWGYEQGVVIEPKTTKEDKGEILTDLEDV